MPRGQVAGPSHGEKLWSLFPPRRRTVTDTPNESGPESDPTPPAEQAVQQASASEPPKSGRSWTAIVVGVIGAAAIAGLAVFLSMTLSDKSDVEADLAQAEQAAEESEDQLELVRSQLDAANSQAADARDRADRAETRASELEPRAADADRMEALLIEFFQAASVFAAGASESEAQCVMESMVAQVGTIGMLEGVVAVITNPFLGDPLADELEIAQDECGVAPPPGLEPGETYGDNPTLDVLWDACSDGDGAACDTLYQISEIGSEYERFGGTCGDRYATVFDAPLYCAEDE